MYLPRTDAAGGRRESARTTPAPRDRTRPRSARADRRPVHRDLWDCPPRARSRPPCRTPSGTNGLPGCSGSRKRITLRARTPQRTEARRVLSATVGTAPNTISSAPGKGTMASGTEQPGVPRGRRRFRTRPTVRRDRHPTGEMRSSRRRRARSSRREPSADGRPAQSRGERPVPVLQTLSITSRPRRRASRRLRPRRPHPHGTGTACHATRRDPRGRRCRPSHRGRSRRAADHRDGCTP